MTQQQYAGAPVGPNGPQELPDDAIDVQPVDYFAFNANERYTLPDGKQWIEFKAMNEGDKRAYQHKTTRDFVVDRRTGDTKVKVDPGEERKILIETCVTDWYILRGGHPVPLTPINLSDFLTLTNPSLVEELEKKIRDFNPWLLDNVTVEALDEQIEDLTRQRDTLKDRQRGEAS